MAYIDRVKRKGITLEVHDYRLSNEVIEAIQEGGVAPLISPSFTGTPTVPTPDGTESSAIVNVNYCKDDVKGPANSVTNHIVVFNDETGKVIKDSGISLTGLASSVHGHVAGDITGGTLGGAVKASATASANLSNAQVRNAIISTTDIGVNAALAAGTIYIVYEA